MSFTSYSVDNDRKFRQALNRAYSQVTNLTVPLTLIAKDWFRSNKAIFQLKGPGQYPDLAISTKKYKQRKWNKVYPILEAKGRLKESLLNPAGKESINKILNKSILVVGTSVPYGYYHQSDAPRKTLPLRKFVFIGPESVFNADSEIQGRLERWTNTLAAYVAKVTQREISK